MGSTYDVERISGLAVAKFCSLGGQNRHWLRGARADGKANVLSR
jgi:hypothetical protein